MTTWNMAGLRARTYKVPKRAAPKPVGPTNVPMVDHAGVLLNGVPTSLHNALKLNNPYEDRAACYCGFVVCGCDRRCDDCGSLLHLADACDAEWSVEDQYTCEGCGDTVYPDHVEDECIEAHTNRLKFAEEASAPPYDPKLVEAFVNNVAPTHGTTLLAIRTTLDAWATNCQASRFAGMSDKAYERCKSWLLSIHHRKGRGLAEMIALLKSFNEHDKERLEAQRTECEKLLRGTPRDFAKLLNELHQGPGLENLKDPSSYRFNFPLQQSLEHGQDLARWSVQTHSTSSAPMTRDQIIGIANELR